MRRAPAGASVKQAGRIGLYPFAASGVRMRSSGVLLTAAFSLLAACGLAWPTPTDLPDRGPSREEIRREAMSRARRSLNWAEQASLEAAEGRLQPLHDFFADAKRRTPQFAASVLGWSSKWRFVADKMPFTEGDRHARYLRQTFNDQLFAPEDLTRAMEQVASSYGDSLSEIENRMLVKLRHDLSDLPPSALPEFADESVLSSAYQDALGRTLNHVGSDLKADVAKELVSLVAGEVLTQVAVRLGVSAGILSAGASTSWATFGAGLAAGVIVDQLVGWVWNWWADPAGNLSAELNDRLDQLERSIVSGDGQTPGLKQALAEFAKRRAEVRRAAIMELLAGNEHEACSGATP